MELVHTLNTLSAIKSAHIVQIDNKGSKAHGMYILRGKVAGQFAEMIFATAEIAEEARIASDDALVNPPAKNDKWVEAWYAYKTGNGDRIIL